MTPSLCIHIILLRLKTYSQNTSFFRLKLALDNIINEKKYNIKNVGDPNVCWKANKYRDTK